MYFPFAVKILYTTILFLYTYNNQGHQNLFQEFAWSLDSAGAAVKATILERSTKTNRICYFIMLLLGLTVVILWPVWGDQNELFLYTQVFEYFLGNGRKYCPIFILQLIQSCVTEVFNCRL
jgi:hypothetical protein